MNAAIVAFIVVVASALKLVVSAAFIVALVWLVWQGLQMVGIL